MPVPDPVLELAGVTIEALTAACVAAGEPAFRARQVLAWVHQRGATSLDAMTDLPAALRAAHQHDWRARTTTVARRAESRDGTTKLLVRAADGQAVEAVLIPEEDRRTLCVSTQAGCGMACRFCATGTLGLLRNLTAAEIVEQVLHARDVLGGASPTNLVFMGMGEPLANFPALATALQILNAPWGTGIGARRMTVSTVGLPDRIRELAALGLEVNLAVSLHAPDDAIRTTLVPTNGRRVTFEYVLLDGVNDGPAEARALGRLLHGFDCLVNLLPMNPVPGLSDRAPAPARVDAFVAELVRAGVKHTLRRRRGDDIAAACGQLRLADAAAPNPA
jgi:23S rRNA (adenine2503-C2)-methyltransferase